MAKLRWLILALGLGVLILAGVVTIEAQALVCARNPLIGPVVDTRALPLVNNFDPCTNRFTMLDEALKATDGPYLSKTEVENRASANIKFTKVRSYFVTYGQFIKMMNMQFESSQVYTNREVWLVVVQAPDQGPEPDLMMGVKPWPRRYYFIVYDATTGRVLDYGGNGPNDGDWPATLPKD